MGYHANCRRICMSGATDQHDFFSYGKNRRDLDPNFRQTSPIKFDRKIILDRVEMIDGLEGASISYTLHMLNIAQ